MDDSLEQLADVFKALGDTTRLRIVKLLGERGETCVCEIVPALGVPQSTVSHHLATLRHAGLVRQRREGQMIFYALVESQKTSAAVEFMQRALDRLGAGVR